MSESARGRVVEKGYGKIICAKAQGPENEKKSILAGSGPR